MTQRFYTKGTGENRKVIPIKSGTGLIQAKPHLYVSPNMIKSQNFLEFMRVVGYVYMQFDVEKKVNDTLIEHVKNFKNDEEFNNSSEKRLEIATIEVDLELLNNLLTNMMGNLRIIISNPPYDYGPIIQSIYMNIDRAIELENKINKLANIFPKETADLFSVDNNLPTAREVLMESFRKVRKDDFQKYKIRKAKEFEAEKKNIPHFRDYDAYLRWQGYIHSHKKLTPYKGKYVLIDGKRHFIKHSEEKGKA